MSDEEIPRANITRILKSALPEGVSISQDARVAFGRAAKVFVLYLTACANDLCMKSDRSIVSANDILGAIKETEFEQMLPILTEVLAAYKAEQAAKRKKIREAKGQTGGDDADKQKKADEDEVDVDDDAGAAAEEVEDDE